FDEHDQISGGTAAHAGVAEAAERDVVPRGHAGRHLHRHRVALAGAPIAAARLARLRHDVAFALAARARRDVHELAEHRLLHPPHLAAALALRAHGLALAAAAMAGLAALEVLDADLLLHARRDLLEPERPAGPPGRRPPPPPRPARGPRRCRRRRTGRRTCPRRRSRA